MKKVFAFAILFYYALFQEVQANETTPSIEQSCKAPTVVLVHGFMASHRNMRRISYFLRCGGAETYLWDYPSRKRTLREHGCYLNRLLNHIAKEKPGVPIYFVTHSTGGLILRAALNLSNCPEEAKIGRAVLIAPPNQGAVFARRMGKYQIVRTFMGKKSGRELICYCASDVYCLGHFPPCIDILVLAGDKSPWEFLFCEPNDGFVTIDETRLETVHRHAVFNLTHSQLILHSDILAKITEFILCGCQNEKACCD